MVEQPIRDQQRPGARELARRAMKAQVREMAIELILQNGYEQTTIDDICAFTGISRSTFFRYFPTKEDVVLAGTAAAGDELLRALQQRPGTETPWNALRHALGSLLEHYDPQPERMRIAKLAMTTPALATPHQERRATWHELLRPEIARRLGSDPHDATDPRPHALIAAALSCLDAAVAAWAAGNGTPELTQVLHRAMDSISP